MKFKLATILTLKENVEKQKQKELGAANTQLQTVEQQKIALHIKQQQTYQTLREETASIVNLQTWRETNHYMKQLNQKITQNQEEVENAKQQVHEKQIALQDAVKERKILENLKEKHHEEYMQELKHKENMILDELVSYKYSSTESRA